MRSTCALVLAKEEGRYNNKLKYWDLKNLNTQEKNELLEKLCIPPIFLTTEGQIEVYMNVSNSDDRNLTRMCAFHEIHDLIDPITTHQFYFQLQLLQNIHKKTYFNYKFECFFDESRGYFIFHDFPGCVRLLDVALYMNLSQLKAYFLNFLTICRDVDEERGAICSTGGAYKIGVNLSDLKQALLYYYGDIFEQDTECYIDKRNYMLEHKIARNSLPVFRSRWGTDYVVVKADKMWNRYHFIFHFRWHVKFSRHRTPIGFKQRLATYYTYFRSTNDTFISWEELEDLVRSMDQFTAEDERNPQFDFRSSSSSAQESESE